MSGSLVVISSPSGGGKDTVIREVIKSVPNSAKLISTTTRPPRPGEVHTQDYYFISEEEFQNKISTDEFIEYNEYAGHFYGTEKSKLQALLNEKDLVLTSIETNGKKNFDRQQIAHLSIFLLPENLETLKKRIITRGGLTPEIIKDRLETAKREIREADRYDYRVVNYQGKLPETVAEVLKILKSELGLDKNQLLN